LKKESHCTGHNIGMGRKNDIYEGFTSGELEIQICVIHNLVSKVTDK
jgi:hypothetical protein